MMNGMLGGLQSGLVRKGGRGFRGGRVKTKAQIVKDWLPRYTGRPLAAFGQYVLLTNFSHYIEDFAARFGAVATFMAKPFSGRTGSGHGVPCGGRRAIVADISERDVVVAILAHLGLPTEAPPIARARSPGFDFT